MKNNEKTLSEQEKVDRDKNGRWLPGKSGNPDGCPQGVKQKGTQIKLGFYEVFDKVGGIDELANWVGSNKTNKKEFYKMLLQILPKEIVTEGSPADTKIIIIKNYEDFVKHANSRIGTDTAKQ